MRWTRHLSFQITKKPLLHLLAIIVKSPTIIAFIKLSIGSTFRRDFDFAAEKLKEVTLTLTPAR